MSVDTNLDGRIYCFTCRNRHTHPKEWSAKLTLIQMSELPYVASLAVDGYLYTFIIGHYINGFYISIPSLFKSADIAQLYDIAYNE